MENSGGIAIFLVMLGLLGFTWWRARSAMTNADDIKHVFDNVASKNNWTSETTSNRKTPIRLINSEAETGWQLHYHVPFYRSGSETSSPLALFSETDAYLIWKAALPSLSNTRSLLIQSTPGQLTNWRDIPKLPQIIGNMSRKNIIWYALTMAGMKIPEKLEEVNAANGSLQDHFWILGDDANATQAFLNEKRISLLREWTQRENSDLSPLLVIIEESGIQVIVEPKGSVITEDIVEKTIALGLALLHA